MEYKWDSSKTIKENADIIGITYNIAYQYAKTRKLTYRYSYSGKLNIDRKCANCKKVMPISNFYRRSKYKETQLYKSYCKECYHNSIYPEKLEARNILRNAIRDGNIKKPDICTRCKNKFPKNKIQGHHSDYSKPLEVIWLCQKCHNEIHKAAQKL